MIKSALDALNNDYQRPKIVMGWIINICLIRVSGNMWYLNPMLKPITYGKR
jgi:hypothetical protein